MFFKNLQEPYLIAEIGINHNGDLQIAKKLLDATFACGWNCAKFQKRNPDVCVPEHQKSVKRETPWGTMSYLEYKYRIEFGTSEFDAISNYCHEKPLDWSASVWDMDSLAFIASYDVPFIKIPSAKLTNFELLIAAGKSGKPVIISTGMSTELEIEQAVKCLTEQTSDICILHTNSSYPAPYEELNLNVIPALKKKYPQFVIGYSGHESDLEASVVAVGLGAMVVERHVTLSHDLWGTDQKSSLEFVAMDMLAKRIKHVPAMLGGSERRITSSEVSIRKKLRGDDVKA